MKLKNRLTKENYSNHSENMAVTINDLRFISPLCLNMHVNLTFGGIFDDENLTFAIFFALKSSNYFEGSMS